MKLATTELSFETVDEWGFAAAAGRLGSLPNQHAYAPRNLGALLELWSLTEGGQLPSSVLAALTPNGPQSFLSALERGYERWLDPERRFGFIRASRQKRTGDAHLTSFLMDAQRAAAGIAGFAGSRPGQLAAAMRELENNIHEHSGAPESGLLAFRTTEGKFEFVTMDRGCGVLDGFQRSGVRELCRLTDHGIALKVALQDGVSRYGIEVGRGFGFRAIFLGLVSMYGAIRFRSGDHALLIQGQNPDRSNSQLIQKPNIDGFLASVSVRTSAR